MNKLKKFWKDHKTVICIVGGTIVITTIYFLLKGKGEKRCLIDITGKEAITWDPTTGASFNFEEAKAVLEANKNNSATFAIFREGSNPSAYDVIQFDDIFITA